MAESETNSASGFPPLIDGVLVINLDHRPERWESFQEQVHGLIPAAKLSRVSAVLGKELPGFGQKPWFRNKKRDLTWAARGGCTLSHRRALEMARERGWKTVLILEDDVVLEENLSRLLPALATTLAAKDSTWDICYLGFTDPLPPFRHLGRLTPEHTLEQVFGCNTAHAYLVKAQARDWMLANLPHHENIWSWLSRNRAVDRWYLRNLGRRFGVVCVSPSAINQAPGFSDIVNRDTDYLSGDSHQLAVPEQTGGAFPLLTALRRLQLGGSDVYDGLRGLIKKKRGF